MNVFFFLAGILTIIFAIMHAIWGEKKLMDTLENSDLTTMSKAAFNISWHQITAVLLVAGLLLTILSFFTNLDGQQLIALTVIFFFSGCFLTFVAFSLIKYPKIFKQTLPQAVLFIIIFALVLIGFFN